MKPRKKLIEVALPLGAINAALSQTDTVRLRNEAKQMSVPVKAPGAPVLHDFDARLVMAIEELIGNPTRWSLVGELESLGAKPLYADHCDDLLRQNASDGGVWLEVFEAGHVLHGVHADFTGKTPLADVLPQPQGMHSIISTKETGSQEQIMEIIGKRAAN